MQFKGITLKMTSAIVIAVLATAAATTIAAAILVSYSLRIGMRTRLEETAKILKQALSSEQQQLATRVEVNAAEEDFQKHFAVRSVDAPTVEQDLSDRLPRLHATVGMLAESDGTRAVAAKVPGAPSPDFLSTSVALRLARKTSKVSTTVELGVGSMWMIAAVPIQYGEQTNGFFLAARPIDTAMLGELQAATGSDVLLVQGGKLVGSTVAVESTRPLESIEKSGAKGDVMAVDGLVTASGEALGEAIILRAGDQVQGALVGALSARETRSLQRRLLGASVGLATLTMLLFGVVGIVIASRIAGPIVEIEHSFREIAASGDLSRRITRDYGDEVGLLASSFNQMQGRIEQLHHQVAEAEQRMRGELQMASAVQEMLFPTQVIDGARCQFASHLQPSSETGGDWFTLLHLPEQGMTTVIVADVTGHGAAAALVTAILHGFFKATQQQLAQLDIASWGPVTHQILRHLNNVIIESTRRSLVCSLICVAFDHRTLKVHYTNAGHVTPMVARMTGGKIAINSIAINPSSLIGEHEDPSFVSGEIPMQPADLFLLYTDGLVECTNAEQEQYGRRLRRSVERALAHDARTACNMVITDALQFFGDTPRADDITLVVGKVR